MHNKHCRTACHWDNNGAGKWYEGCWYVERRGMSASNASLTFARGASRFVDIKFTSLPTSGSRAESMSIKAASGFSARRGRGGEARGWRGQVTAHTEGDMDRAAGW